MDRNTLVNQLCWSIDQCQRQAINAHVFIFSRNRTFDMASLLWIYKFCTALYKQKDVRTRVLSTQHTPWMLKQNSFVMQLYMVASRLFLGSGRVLLSLRHPFSHLALHLQGTTTTPRLDACPTTLLTSPSRASPFKRPSDCFILAIS